MERTPESARDASLAEIDQHIQYFERWLKQIDERIALWQGKKQKFTKRLEFAKQVKDKLTNATSLDEIDQALSSILEDYKKDQLES